MPIFKKSAQDEQKFAGHINKINKAIETLSPYGDYIDLSRLEKIRDSFITKTEDFFREDRELNIGVIGQVKAGKSSFLNTLLFGGKKVLPSAATPKTATLTKIEYSEENKLVIEYYSAGEWEILESNARVESKENEFEAAREIVKLCAEKGLVPAEYIAKGSDEFLFSSAEELMERLDDYVGENGKYTALVKNVTIYMNNPELKDISVVDTPGLNDAIVSRTDRTRQFIELCDVVFFLSRASQFLDKNDLRLLTSQLPQKGVKKMVMICSRFDDGISDTIYDVDSIEEAIEQTRDGLAQRAASVIKGQNIDASLTKVLEPCRNPIFVSSLCWNMSCKEPSAYDRQEQLVMNNINEYGDVTSDVLRQIGNIDEVRSIYEEVIEQKEDTLAAKAGGFVPASENELKNTLTELRQTAEKNLEILRTGDREQLTKQKKFMASQINGIKGSVEAVFGEMLASLDRARIDTMQLLREASRDCAVLTDKQGTETHVSSYTVSDSKLFKPSTWGKSHREYLTYETHYTYLDASDALENIRTFANDSCSYIEKAFFNTVDVIGTKRKLLNVVVENFDASSDLYDPALFRLITEQTLNKVEFPAMKLDISKEQAQVSSKFSGEVRDSRERSELRRLLSETIGSLLQTVEQKFLDEVNSFRSEIEKMKSGFSGQLLENIESDFNKLLQQFENKEKEISNYEILLTLFKEVQKL